MSEQVKFEYSAFWSKISEFQEKLGEFWFIHEAVEAADSNDIFHSEGIETPGRISFLIGETAPFYVDFQYFNYEFDDDEAAKEHWKGKLEGWQKEGASWAVEKVSAITPKFENLVYAKPEDLNSAGLDFTDVATTLATEVPRDFGGLVYGTDQWEGVAAFNFFNNFYNPMVDCVDNQEWLANMLMRGCAFAKGIIDAGQHSCMTTVTTMVERVQDALEQRQDAHSISPSEWIVIAETALSLVDYIPLLDAVKTKPTGIDETPEPEAGTSYGDQAKGAAEGFLGWAKDKIPEDAKYDEKASEWKPEGLAKDFSDAVDTINKNVKTHWDAFETDFVNGLKEQVDTIEKANLLVVKRPDLASGNVPPGDFHHESSDQYS